jgi:hypothetical protein
LGEAEGAAPHLSRDTPTPNAAWLGWDWQNRIRTYDLSIALEVVEIVDGLNGWVIQP